MNILHLITGLNAGGAEKVVFDLASNATKENHIVIGISEADFLREKFEKSGINVHILGMKKNPISVFKTIKKIIQIIKNENVHILHVHLVDALFVGSILKLVNRNIRIVYTFHSINPGNLFRKTVLLLSKKTRNIDVVFSEKSKSIFSKKNTVIIPNGIKTKNFDYSKAKFDLFTFIIIGRLEKVKNHLSLIETLSKVNKKLKYQLLIVGDGVLRDDIEKKISSLGLKDKIKVLGFRKDISDLCNKSHVLLCASLWEGLPITILEAGASKLPIISTPVGSIPEIIKEEDGVVCDLEEFPIFMEKAILEYSYFDKKADCFYKKVKANFEMDIVLNKYSDVYNRVLS